MLQPLPVRQVVVLLVATILASSPSFAAPRASTRGDMVPGEVLVKFRPEASESAIRAVLDDLGATRIRRFRRLGAERHRIARYTPVEAAQRYRHHPAVEAIEPNWIVAADRVPNDPLFPQQWGLRNAGQTGGIAGADIDAIDAWDVQTGSPNVVIAVLDTGIDYTHPDLAGNIWTNPGEVPGNGVDDDGNGWIDDVHGYDFFDRDPDPMDENGHGTHVAGIAAAVGNNGIGVTGVGWSVRVMALKFLDPNGFGPVSGAVEAIEYALEMGAQVLSNSWGGGDFSTFLFLAIQEAGQQGVPFVAAAGNSALSLDEFTHYPASYDAPNVIVVGSTTHADQLSSFSNFGRDAVDLAAPGSEIWSTRMGGDYGVESGTSMAAPLVSGALALLRSRFPAIPGDQMKTVLLSSADHVLALDGLIAEGRRLNALRLLGGFDSIPPDPVGDLAVYRIDSNRIRLRWTATGDDGRVGQARRYEIRYATQPLDNLTFATGALVSAPLPAPAGTAQEVEVRGLAFETTYFFALRAFDEFANGSHLSNVASGRTLMAPDVAVTPGQLARSLVTGQVVDEALTIRNETAGTLEFSIMPVSTPGTSPIAVTAGGATAMAAEVPAVATPAQRAGALAASLQTLPKGAPDPRVGIASVEGRGGPDIFGHRWFDSDQPGGPVFQWIDIRDVGTPIDLTGDDATSRILSIGFAFPFYGNVYSFIRVCTNGFLTFGSSATDFANQPLPSFVAPEGMIAPFWDDLVFGSGSSATYRLDGSRFIVQWTDVVRFGGGGPYTFQAILHEDGTIDFQYFSMASPTISATVGIHSPMRDDGLQIIFNNTYVHDGLAVRILETPRWLTANPGSGILGPYESRAIGVRLDARGLAGGEHRGLVRVTSNDPDEAAVEIPVSLTITEAADITPLASSLAFVQIPVGSVDTEPLLVRNDGVLPLHLASFEVSPDAFAVDSAPVTLDPGEIAEILIRFQPTQVGSVYGTLTIRSDDPDEPAVTVSLNGYAIQGSIEATIMEITPTTLRIGSRGRAVTVRVELPAGYDPSRVDPASVRLEDVVPLAKEGFSLQDFNRNGVPDLELKFDRAAVEAVLPDSSLVTVSVTGEIPGVGRFTATSNLRVIRRRHGKPSFALLPNVPNPFNPATTMRFDLASPGRATMRVFAVDGRLVREWRLGELPAGPHDLLWDGKDSNGRDVGSGVYFSRLKVDGSEPLEAHRAMMLIK